MPSNNPYTRKAARPVNTAPRPCRRVVEKRWPCAVLPRATEFRPGHEQRRDVVAAAGGIGGFHQRGRYARRVAIVALHDFAHLGGRQMIGQAVAAQQNGGVRMEPASPDLDETRLSRRARPRAHVAENFVAARMQHGFGFRERARVLVLAHRRMVGGELADGAVPNQVESRVAYVPHRDHAVFHQRQREHARHAAARVRAARPLVNAVVGVGDGPAHPRFRRPVFENRFADGVHRRLGRQRSRRLARPRRPPPGTRRARHPASSGPRSFRAAARYPWPPRN